MSKFLYGKNKCLITWPLLLYFIINEENEYRLEIYKNESKLEEKYLTNINIINQQNKEFEFNLKINELKKKEELVYFLSWKNNSCRYDVFFYLFTYIILPTIDKIDKFENDNINILKNISKELYSGNKRIFDGGIWNLLNNYKTKFFDLTTSEKKYKQFNSFLQCINILMNDPLFCIKYTTIEGCSLCNYQTTKNNYFQPFVEINEQDLKDNIDLNTKLNIIFQNISSTCMNCGYAKDGKIINKDTYYKIITTRLNPLYLFICFEFMGLNSGEFGDYLEQEIKNYEIRIKYNKDIIKYIMNKKIINNDEYVLVGVITTPSNDHYTGILINLSDDINKLVKNNSYYYDSRSVNHDIIGIENLDECLNNNNPYIALYKKK